MRLLPRYRSLHRSEVTVQRRIGVPRVVSLRRGAAGPAGTERSISLLAARRRRSSNGCTRNGVTAAAARGATLAARRSRVRRRRVRSTAPLSSARTRSPGGSTAKPGTCGGTRSRFRSCARVARRVSRAGFRSPDRTMRKRASRWGCGPFIGVGGTESRKLFERRATNASACARRVATRWLKLCDYEPLTREDPTA